MKKSLRLTFRRGDFLALGLVVVLAAGIAAGFWKQIDAEEPAAVQIYQDGQLVQELSLFGTEEQSVVITGRYSNRVVIRDGKAAIVESDCPGNDCVSSGWISEAGRNLVCLPNRVEVRVVGTSDVDFVVR